MKVYLAGPWIKGGDVLEASKQFEAAGIEITSRWLERVKGNTDPAYDYTKDPLYTAPDAKEEATKDMEDVFNADMVVVINSAKSEGKAVETGLALAWGIPIVVVGDRTNIFHYFDAPITEVVGTVAEAITLSTAFAERFNL